MSIQEEKICVSTISQKGLTTIPKEVRDLLRIHTGDRILFKIDHEGNVSVQKALLLPAEK